MLINVKTVMKNYKGEGIPMNPNKTEPEDDKLRLGDMIITALNQPHEKDKNLEATAKLQRAVTSQDVHNAMKDDMSGEMDFKSEEITEFKDLINRHYYPMALKAAYDVLDPDTKVDDDNKETGNK